MGVRAAVQLTEDTLSDFSLPVVSEWVACVRSNFLVLCYLRNVKNILQLHDLTTGALLKTFPLDVGSVVGYSGRKKDSEIFYQFTSFLSPGEREAPHGGDVEFLPGRRSV